MEEELMRNSHYENDIRKEDNIKVELKDVGCMGMY
jgi:hypothetical protein